MWSRLRSLTKAVFHRSRFEDDMTAEIGFHLEAYADELIRSGVSRTEAVRGGGGAGGGRGCGWTGGEMLGALALV